MSGSRRPARRRRGRAVYWSLVVLCAVIGIGGLAVAAATTRTFTAASISMENTIRPGDLVIAARTGQVHRGDVIAEEEPSVGPGVLIRRVIGLPGDRVACCTARGQITVNGIALHETYLYPGSAPSAARFRVTVPPGRLYLLGDHRSVALDSRRTGPLAVHVLGRVFLVIRSAHPVLVRTPQAFTAAGLAPASGLPLAVLAAAATAVALAALILLAIGGLISAAARGRRRRPQREPWSR